MNPSRGARYLLRNGWDYITYQEYERALNFFREAEQRQFELSDAERLRLKQGIDRARRGLREVASGVRSEPAYARSGPNRRPGSLAVAKPANAGKTYEREPIQLAGAPAGGINPKAVVRTSAPAEAVTAAMPTVPATLPPTPDIEPAPLPAPAGVPPLEAGPAEAPAANPSALSAPELPPPPQDVPLPSLTADPVPAQAAAPEPAQAQAPALDRSADLPLPEPAQAQAPAPVPVPVPVPDQSAELPTPAPAAEAPAPAAPQPAQAPAPEPEPAPEVEKLPPLPEGAAPGPNATGATPEAAPPAEPAPAAPAPAPEASSAPVPEPVPTPAPAGEPPVMDLPGEAPAAGTAPAAPDVADTPPPPMNPGGAAGAAPGQTQAVPEVAAKPRGRFGIDTLIPERRDEAPPSTLTPELQREVQRIAQAQDEEMRRGPAPAVPQPGTAGPDDVMPVPGGSVSTRLEIQRAPSPTEARPIRAIPVPEEFVPLPKRQWEPNRKYWAAAATCHLPLYFQDASLERYGYSMEQRFGPFGRFLSYPVDDPRQSKQRNQIAQPFFSAGLFAAQIALLPYNMIVDPPWEAEYDLGYYRPGDRVPTDVYYLPLFGIGPPLHGANYGLPPRGNVAPSHPRW